MRPDDDELSRLIAGAAPRAPRGTADAVMQRLGARRRVRTRVLLGAGLLAAAALLLLVLRPAPGRNDVATRQVPAGERFTVAQGSAHVEIEGVAVLENKHGMLTVLQGRGRLVGDGAR